MHPRLHSDGKLCILSVLHTPKGAQSNIPCVTMQTQALCLFQPLEASCLTITHAYFNQHLLSAAGVTVL